VLRSAVCGEFVESTLSCARRLIMCTILYMDVALIKTLEYQIGSTPDSGRENRLELLDLTDST
jgi:hypothetical protein